MQSLYIAVRIEPVMWFKKSKLLKVASYNNMSLIKYIIFTLQALDIHTICEQLEMSDEQFVVVPVEQ